MYGSNPHYNESADGTVSVNLDECRLFVNGDEDTAVEPFSGCQGAYGYRKYFSDLGYLYCLPWDLSSSAGDWTFAVSKNGLDWVMGGQENNGYFVKKGKPQFTYSINEDDFVDVLPVEQY